MKTPKPPAVKLTKAPSLSEKLPKVDTENLIGPSRSMRARVRESISQGRTATKSSYPVFKNAKPGADY